MALIKSISGIRGTIGNSPNINLTPLDIVRFSSAYAKWLRDKNKGKLTVVTGRDARISGPMVHSLVNQTLIGMGIDVIDLGLSTTPTVAIAVPMEHADGGIVVTASHNTKQWNALKLLNVQESDSQYLYAPIESGGRADTRDKPKITREAINLEVAPFLYARARKPKDDPSRKVTKRDIKAVIYDTLSRFQPVEERGDRQNVMHHMSSVSTSALNELFPDGNVDYDDSISEWTRYDSRIPFGDDKETSFFRNNDPDSSHNPTFQSGRGINQGKHDKGGLMWWRGFNVNDPYDGEPGVVAFEFQANAHGKAQSARDSEYTYVSQVKDFDETETVEIENRMKEFSIIKSSFLKC